MNQYKKKKKIKNKKLEATLLALTELFNGKQEEKSLTKRTKVEDSKNVKYEFNRRKWR